VLLRCVFARMQPFHALSHADAGSKSLPCAAAQQWLLPSGPVRQVSSSRCVMCDEHERLEDGTLDCTYVQQHMLE